jgi:hypothetical protein
MAGTGLLGGLVACRRADDASELVPEVAPDDYLVAHEPTFETAAFPLQRTPGLRYLVDSKQRPFLLHGDSAWSILVQLTRDETNAYLSDRQRRGFNTVLVNLLEHKYAADAPRNRFGDAPFRDSSDYSSVNDRYFDHAKWLVGRAAESGMLVLLAATYIGCCGEDGWYSQMLQSGAARMRDYGRFLGRKFRDLDNLMWVHGGDANPVDQSIVSEVALGIREADPSKLHTAHTGPGFQAKEVWSSAPWLDVNNVYTYEPVLPIAWRAYKRPDRMPFFLIESEYEGENRHASELRVRAQAWQAVLGGAMGQMVGNNPIWHFASPRPITPFSGTWQKALNSEAARSMTQLRRLLDSVEWWHLEPDMDRSFLTAGACEGHYGAVAARAQDGSLAIVFVPMKRQVCLNFGRMKAGLVRLRWYDPVDGRDGPRYVVSNTGQELRLLPPLLDNAGGNSDWVLLIQAVS